VNIATAYHQLRNADEGIAALREAARLRPDLTVVQNNLAWELAHKGEESQN
jgi:cytochrome c-type biogenesis protein CcmH/NrfG